jgi:hypothetical protein
MAQQRAALLLLFLIVVPSVLKLNSVFAPGICIRNPAALPLPLAVCMERVKMEWNDNKAAAMALCLFSTDGTKNEVNPKKAKFFNKKKRPPELV